MTRPKPPMEVAAGILWRGGRFLGVERPPGTRHAGFWEFPGGKLEPGEAADAALARELDEELGVTDARPEFWRRVVHDYPEFRVHLHFFHVRAFTGEPRPREGQRLQWLTPAEALEKPFLPADEDVVRALGECAGPDA